MSKYNFKARESTSVLPIFLYTWGGFDKIEGFAYRGGIAKEGILSQKKRELEPLTFPDWKANPKRRRLTIFIRLGHKEIESLSSMGLTVIS